MGEFVYANMRIGGKLPRSKLQALIAAIEEQRPDDTSWSSWKNGHIDLTPPDDLDIVDSNGHVTVEDCEASGGHMEPLETFCKENGLPFDLYFDQSVEYGPGIDYYRPGRLPEIECLVCDHERHPVIRVDDLREAIHDVIESDEPTLRLLLDRLETLMPSRDLETLPKFEIVEDPHAQDRAEVSVP